MTDVEARHAACRTLSDGKHDKIGHFSVFSRLPGPSSLEALQQLGVVAELDDLAVALST